MLVMGGWKALAVASSLSPVEVGRRSSMWRGVKEHNGGGEAEPVASE